jgi:hypothetical protein
VTGLIPFGSVLASIDQGREFRIPDTTGGCSSSSYISNRSGSGIIQLPSKSYVSLTTQFTKTGRNSEYLFLICSTLEHSVKNLMRSYALTQPHQLARPMVGD